MHGYSVYSTFSRGRLDTDVVPFYARLMEAFTQKPLLFSEFGNPTCPPGTVSPYNREPLPGEPPPSRDNLPKNAAAYACLTEDEMAMYCEKVLKKLHEQGTIGGLWWCWADYDPSLSDLPPFDRAQHELHFGMIRADGTDKPVAQTLSRIAGEAWEVQPSPPPIAEETDFYASLPQGIDALYRHYRS